MTDTRWVRVRAGDVQRGDVLRAWEPYVVEDVTEDDDGIVYLTLDAGGHTVSTQVFALDGVTVRGKDCAMTDTRERTCPDCRRTVDDRHWYGHRWDVHEDAKTRPVDTRERETRAAVRRAAIDWRKDWHGPGQHGRAAMVPTIGEPAYPRDVAMFDARVRWALDDRWDGNNANGHAYTTDVFRHPEYRAAILRHDPRSVFYPARERRIRALRELRRIAESNRAYRARWGRGSDPIGWRTTAKREAAR